MSVTFPSIVGGAALRADEHPLLLPTLRALTPRLESRARVLARHDRNLRDDLVAEGAHAVAQAVREYDPARHVPLEALATTRAYQRMSNAARAVRTRRHQRTLRLATASESGTIAVDQSAIVDPGLDPLENVMRMEAVTTIAAAIMRLPDREARVAKALLEGYTQTEIAEQFGVSKMAVSKWVAKIRSHMRMELESVVYAAAA